MFENPRKGRQARNFTTNVLKILVLKSSSEQIFSENCRWVPLKRSFTGCLTEMFYVDYIEPGQPKKVLSTQSSASPNSKSSNDGISKESTRTVIPSHSRKRQKVTRSQDPKS